MFKKITFKNIILNKMYIFINRLKIYYRNLKINK